MNREELKKIIPHREPMLLIDSAERLPDGTAVGRYTVRGDEWFLQGHFPGNPVVPGVILCEIMAQTCCVLLAGEEAVKDATPYYTGIDKVKFREKVTVGDTFEITCKIIRNKNIFYFAQGKGTVGEKTALTAEFSFALVKQK